MRKVGEKRKRKERQKKREKQQGWKTNEKRYEKLKGSGIGTKRKKNQKKRDR